MMANETIIYSRQISLHVPLRPSTMDKEPFRQNDNRRIYQLITTIHFTFYYYNFLAVSGKVYR